MKNKKLNYQHIITFILSIWISYVFLGSLKYKFTNSLETQHIFSEIGNWLNTFLPDFIGNIFSNYGGYIIGTIELIASILLLVGSVLLILNKEIKKINNKEIVAIGAKISFIIIFGAIFFHLFTPLGIEVQVPNQASDNGGLFKLAVSILITSAILIYMNCKWFNSK